MSEENKQQPESKLICVKSASLGEDSKGRMKIDLRFSDEETESLKEELSKVSSRAKFQIHLSEEGKYGPSVFLFIKEVSTEKPAFNKAATNSNSKSKSVIDKLKKS